MAMHNTNPLLKIAGFATAGVLGVIFLASIFNHNHADNTTLKNTIQKNAAADSAAESLNTLTAELSDTKKEILDVSKNNEALRKENTLLLQKVNGKVISETSTLATEVESLKNQMGLLSQNKINGQNSNTNTIQTIPDSILVPNNNNNKMLSYLSNDHDTKLDSNINHENNKPRPIPYYTIPANATSVKDKLMTALVGRIPVKGVVTDPYPFKIVISDDNLAANGLRIPHLLQMIVSGYCEGDLNLVSVRGWITSLTFVFDDGTISTTTSNDNDIGNFTKSNSLGYLSDQYGNPFIRGKLITNAPEFLSINAGLGMAAGAANAYSQSQTTSDGSILGGDTAVTGSQSKFVLGQSLSNGTSAVQQWWADREQQSFDAVYVPTTDSQGNTVQIAVNFSKEIHIDYDPAGRKLNYATNINGSLHGGLD